MYVYLDSSFFAGPWSVDSAALHRIVPGPRRSATPITTLLSLA